MDYNKSAEELLVSMVRSEQGGSFMKSNVSEFARGELAVLIFLMDGNDGASANEISQKFQINTSRVAAILNSLCKKGYVIRQPHPEDKRRIQVHPTSCGWEFANQRRRELLNNISIFLQLLGEEDTKEHIRIMKKISGIVQTMKQSG